MIWEKCIPKPYNFRRNTSINASVKRKRQMAALNDDVRTRCGCPEVLFLTQGNRGTLVGESVTLDELYSADCLLAKGYGVDIWHLGDSMLPQLQYDFDPEQDGAGTTVD